MSRSRKLLDVAVAATPPSGGSGGRGGPPFFRPVTPAFLVIAHSVDNTMGKRIPIPAGEVTDVGSAGKGIVLASDDEVADRHLSFAWRDETLWLVPHASRVLVDGEPVNAGCPIAAGARIDVGGAVLRVIIGDRLEAQYHEVIYHLTTTDAVTGLPNRRMFSEHLERGALESGRGGAVVTLELEIAGAPFDDNRMLERAARVVSARAEDRVVARTAPASFAILYDALSPADAETSAAEVVTALEEQGVKASIAEVRHARAPGSRGARPDVSERGGA